MGRNLEAEGRFEVVYLPGEIGCYPHVRDTQKGGIVRFGEGARTGAGDQLFLDPETAEEAARLLNSGVNPEDIEGTW
ncbi:MAG TPA: hypothetical protein VMY36_04390 [Patescibacteria group bacterium]|nr:hypothetical protein [Patescibacteria group bacterium]